MRKVNQSGYLLLSAVFLITVIAVIATGAAYVFTTNTQVVTQMLSGTQALYNAEAGIQDARVALRTPDFNLRVACEAINTNLRWQTAAFASGEFQVISKRYANTASLTRSITESETVIPVNTLSGFAPQGRARIDKEYVRYFNTSQDVAVCGQSTPCLATLIRGDAYTVATAHLINTPVAQDLCSLTATGALPTLHSPLAKRIVSSALLSQEIGWAMGDATDNASTLLMWYGSQWYTTSLLSPIFLYGSTLLSYSDIWAVGKDKNNDPALIHWNGSAWKQVTNSETIPKVTLFGVSCMYSQACWAVGEPDSKSATLLYWNGVTWSRDLSLIDPAASTNVVLKSIDCPSSHVCWAVGEADKTGASVLSWRGKLWTRISLPDVKETLNALVCLNENVCKAAGTSATFLSYHNATWTKDTVSPNFPSVTVNGVTCPSEKECWAVGEVTNQFPLIAHWDGTLWSLVLPQADTPKKALYAVTCLSKDHCWAVGEAGSIVQWDGRTWHPISSPVITALRSVVALGTNETQVMGQWQEVH